MNLDLLSLPSQIVIRILREQGAIHPQGLEKRSNLFVSAGREAARSGKNIQLHADVTKRDAQHRWCAVLQAGLILFF
jgi:hypothetical protein